MPEFISILRYIRDVLYPDIVNKHTQIEDVKLNETNINNVSNNMQSVITVANNENELQAINTQIIPVLEEILNADTNAEIATSKAEETRIHAGNALTASSIAYKWANNPVNIPVENGDFSAYHWAQVASSIVGDGIINDEDQTYITTYSSLKIEEKLSGKLDANESVISADKLTTPRNIVLQGDVDGATSFDGSNNVSIDVSLDIDGATDIGEDLVDADLIMVDNGANGTNRKSTISRLWTYISDKLNGAVSTIKTTDLIPNKVVVSDSNGKIAISTVASSYLTSLSSATSSNTASTLVKRDTSGNFSAGIIDGTITRADKWTTARTINLTGAITGSVSVDGSQNVSITTTLNMDNLDYVNARDYFIIGEADDTGSISRALATGKNVKLDGTFTISSAGYNVGMGGVPQLIFGMNPQADKIRINFNDGSNIFNLLSDYSSVHGIGFEMVSGMKTSGSYVSIGGAYRGNIISKFKMQHCATGISIDGEAVVTVINKGEILDARSGTGVGIYINGGNDTFISKVVMDTGGVEPLAGIRIKRTQAIFVSDVDIIDFGNPLLIDPSSSVSDLVTWCFFNSLACDTSSGNGIKIAPTGGVTVKGLFFDNCWSATNDLCGAYITATGGAVVDGVFFTDSGLIQNTNEGLFVEGNVANVEFNSGRVTGNGRGNNSKAGIRFASTVDGFAVRGSRIGASMRMPVSQTYGIIAEGNPNNFIISDNNLTGNIIDGDLIDNLNTATNSSHLGNIGTTIGNYKNGKKIWDESNDGSGSGLDADLVDGLHSTSFIRSDANMDATGKTTYIKNTPAMNGGSYADGAIELQTTDGSNPIIGFHRVGYSAIALYENGGQLYTRNNSNAEGIVITTANTNFAASNIANSVVYRNGSGNFAVQDIVMNGSLFTGMIRSAVGDKEILWSNGTYTSLGNGTNFTQSYKPFVLNNGSTDSPELVFGCAGYHDWQMDVAGGQVRILQNGNVGLAIDNSTRVTYVPGAWNNTTTDGANLYVSSSGALLRVASSIKYKKDIEDIDNIYVEKFFSNARPIFYKAKESINNPIDWGYWGFIAEEVAEFDKRLVHWRYDGLEVEVKKTKLDHPAEPERIEVIKEEVILDDGTTEIVEKEVVIPAKEATYKEYTTTEFIEDKTKPMIAEGVQYDRITVLLTAKVQEQQKEIDNLKAQLIEIKDLLNFR